MSSLNLLHEENIWILFTDEILEFSLVGRRTDTIHVPGDDTHKS